MIKKVLALAGLLSFFGGSLVSKAAEGDMNWGIGGHGGLAFMGIDRKDTSGQKANADMSFGGGGGLFYGYDISNLFGVETSLGYVYRTLGTVKPSSGKKAYAYAFQTVEFDILAKAKLVDFPGGGMFLKLGPVLYYIFAKEASVDERVSQTEQKNKDEMDSINNFNLGPRLVVGIDMLDDMLSIGLGGSFFVLNLLDSSTTKAINDKTGAIGRQIDVHAFLGFNFASLMN